MELKNTKKWKFIKLFLVSLTVFGFGFLFAWWSLMPDDKNLDFSCSSNITSINKKDDVKMNTIAHFFFKPGGEGIVTLDGEVNVKGNTYYLSRTISLQYENFGRNLYYLKEYNPKINGGDTLPEKMFEKRIFSSRYVYFSKMDNYKNAMVIASRLTPISVCIMNSN